MTSTWWLILRVIVPVFGPFCVFVLWRLAHRVAITEGAAPPPWRPLTALDPVSFIYFSLTTSAASLYNIVAPPPGVTLTNASVAGLEFTPLNIMIACGVTSMAAAVFHAAAMNAKADADATRPWKPNRWMWVVGAFSVLIGAATSYLSYACLPRQP